MYIFHLNIIVINIVLLGIIHFVSDWMFQTDEEALGKVDNPKIRARHCFKYSTNMALAFIILNGRFLRRTGVYILMVLAIVFLWFFITHYLIDDRKFVIWWIKNIKGLNKENPYNDIFVIVLDQITHIIAIIPPAILIILMRGW